MEGEQVKRREEDWREEERVEETAEYGEEERKDEILG